MAAPIPDNEPARLAALRRSHLLDTDPEEAYDGLTRLAAQICGAPIAAVSLIDADRQWFKASCGLSARETSRDAAFCAYTILQTELLLVPDTHQDARFAANPLVTGEPGIRFYAGVPLITAEGHALGSLCVIDTVPRRLTPSQEEALRLLARQAASLIELTRRTAVQEKLIAEKRDVELEAARLAAIVASSEDAISASTLDGTLVSWNAGAERLYGYAAAEVIGRNVSALVAPGEASPVPDAITRLQRGEAVAPIEVTRTRKDGTSMDLSLSVSPIRDGRGEITGLSCITRDITAHKRADAALRKSEARLAEAQRVAHLGSWEFTVASGEMVWSEELYHILGFDPAAAMPDLETVVARYHPEDLPARNRAFTEALTQGVPYETDLRILLPDGRTRWCHTVGRPVLNDAGQTVRLVGTTMDIDAQKQAEQKILDYSVVLEFQKQELERANAELAALATMDGLTGVHNRRAFDARMSQEFERAARYGTPLSLVLLDIDHFKELNDSFGHTHGDDVLRRVGRLLQQATRETDIVARYGGEEFALILPATDSAGALLLAERVRRAIATARWKKRPVTASLGVATLHLGLETPTDLVSCADRSLYRSKADGRDRVTSGHATA